MLAVCIKMHGASSRASSTRRNTKTSSPSLWLDYDQVAWDGRGGPQITLSIFAPDDRRSTRAGRRDKAEYNTHIMYNVQAVLAAFSVFLSSNGTIMIPEVMASYFVHCIYRTRDNDYANKFVLYHAGIIHRLPYTAYIGGRQDCRADWAIVPSGAGTAGGDGQVGVEYQVLPGTSGASAAGVVRLKPISEVELGSWASEVVIRCPNCYRAIPAGLCACILCDALLCVGSGLVAPAAQGAIMAAITSMDIEAEIQKTSRVAAYRGVTHTRTLRTDFYRSVVAALAWRENWVNRDMEAIRNLARRGFCKMIPGAGKVNPWHPRDQFDDRPCIEDIIRKATYSGGAFPQADLNTIMACDFVEDSRLPWKFEQGPDGDEARRAFQDAICLEVFNTTDPQLVPGVAAPAISRPRTSEFLQCRARWREALIAQSADRRRA